MASTTPPPAPPYIDLSRLLLPLSPSGTPHQLGRGNFGVVYAALLDAASPVAVKVLRVPPARPSSPNPLHDASSRHGAVAARHFRREVKRYAALRGVKGVARFYGVAPPTASVDLFVTERLSGGTLRDALKQGSLDPSSSLRVGNALATALAELHRLGYTHGDVKPANVLFSEPISHTTRTVTEGIKVKLIDFGLSRSFATGSSDSSDDEDSVVSFSSRASAPPRVNDDHAIASFLGPLDARGTPAFLSPEAWCGAKALSDRSVAEKADVYALAMVLFQLETGTTPWVDLSEWGIFVAVCNHGERPPWPDGPDRIPGLRALAERCWVQDHRERLTCQQIADELVRLRFANGYIGTSGAEPETLFPPSVPNSPIVPGITTPLVSYISALEDASLSPPAINDVPDEKGRAVARASTSDPVAFRNSISAVSESASDVRDGENDDDLDKSALGDHENFVGRPDMEAANEHNLLHNEEVRQSASSQRQDEVAATADVPRTTVSDPVRQFQDDYVRGAASAMDAAPMSNPKDDSQASNHQVDQVGQVDNAEIASRSAGAVQAQQLLGRRPHQTEFVMGDKPSSAKPDDVVADQIVHHVLGEQLSVDEVSTSGGYEADTLSQRDIQQNSASTTGLLGATQNNPAIQNIVSEARDEELSPQSGEFTHPIRSQEEFEPASDGKTDITVPESVRSLNYAFKNEVMSNNCTGLCKALGDNVRNPRRATRILEALCVLLENDQENCELFVDRSGMRIVSSIISRYGSTDNRLCKSACLIVYRMAACQSTKAETELRTTGACEIVLNAIRWHPANLPVVQNAACAINILCRASAALCSIVLALGGADCALRVLARGSKSFGRDVPVASAGLEVIGLIAKSASGVETLAENDAVQKVLECCDIMKDERIDRHCLGILFSLTRHGIGQDKILSTTGSMTIVYALIERIRESPDPCPKLKIACDVISALADVPEAKRQVARNAFLSSYAGEAVVLGVETCAELSTDANDFSDIVLIISGFECFRSLSTLGQDVCGALQMARVFEVTRTILDRFPSERRIATEALLFLHSILRELRGISFGAHLDIVFEVLVQLQERWREDFQMLRSIDEAKRIVREATNGEESRWMENVTSEESAEPEIQHRSSLRLFRRKPVKNR